MKRLLRGVVYFFSSPIENMIQTYPVVRQKMKKRDIRFMEQKNGYRDIEARRTFNRQLRGGTFLKKRKLEEKEDRVITEEEARWRLAQHFDKQNKLIWDDVDTLKKQIEGLLEFEKVGKKNFGFIHKDLVTLNGMLQTYNEINKHAAEALMKHKTRIDNNLDVIKTAAEVVRKNKTRIDNLENRFDTLIGGGKGNEKEQFE